MAENKVKYGFSNVHIAFFSESGYEVPISIPGAIQFSSDANGDSNDFYADNGKYFSQTKKDGYTGSIELALFPDAVKARMCGDYIDSNGGYVEDADGTPEHFALMGQIEGDAKARRFVFFDTLASRPGNSANTSQGSINPDTDSVNLTMFNKSFTIGESPDQKTVKTPFYYLPEGATGYDTFFSAVVEPSTKAAG